MFNLLSSLFQIVYSAAPVRTAPVQDKKEKKEKKKKKKKQKEGEDGATGGDDIDGVAMDSSGQVRELLLLFMYNVLCSTHLQKILSKC